MTKTTRGLVLLSAVAALSASAADKVAPKPKEEAKISCEGINECKSKGACSGAGHSCAGKNECKGKGWVSVTAKECADKKGKNLGASPM